MKRIELFLLGASIVAWIGTAQATTDQEKCVAGKIAAAGKYAACRTNADKKAELSAMPADYIKCDAKQLAAWTKIEAKYTTSCPTSGEQAAVQTELSDVTTAQGYFAGFQRVCACS
jgi:hypothetical protein